MDPLLLMVAGLVVFNILCQACGLMLAGYVTRYVKISPGAAISLALVWTLLYVGYLTLALLAGSLLVSFLAWWVQFAVVVWILKAVFKLSLRKTVALKLTALLMVFAVGAAVYMPARTFYLQPYKIPGFSMHPTVTRGDYVLVNKQVYRGKGPQRWDVAVVRFSDGRPRIKRVVGLPGELIEIRDGAVWINTEALEPPDYLKNTQWVSRSIFACSGKPFQIPRDSYFVLGDNGTQSRDSRYLGPVSRENLIGRAFYRYWPRERRGEI